MVEFLHFGRLKFAAKSAKDSNACNRVRYQVCACALGCSSSQQYRVHRIKLCSRVFTARRPLASEQFDAKLGYKNLCIHIDDMRSVCHGRF